MAVLIRANLVESALGKSGGYRLTRPPADYPVGEILRAAEGDLSPISCQAKGKTVCGQSCDCDARFFWQGHGDKEKRQHLTEPRTADTIVQTEDTEKSGQRLDFRQRLIVTGGARHGRNPAQGAGGNLGRTG